MSSRGGLLPNLGARGAMTRSSGASDTAGSDSPAYTLLNGSLDASWGLDLFGGVRRGREASQERLRAAQGSWDEARVPPGPRSDESGVGNSVGKSGEIQEGG